MGSPCYGLKRLHYHLPHILPRLLSFTNFINLLPLTAYSTLSRRNTIHFDCGHRGYYFFWFLFYIFLCQHPLAQVTSCYLQSWLLLWLFVLFSCDSWPYPIDSPYFLAICSRFSLAIYSCRFFVSFPYLVFSISQPSYFLLQL